MNEYRIRAGASTRPVKLTTGENVRFAKKALDNAAQQVGSGFIPMSVEHLSYLPPRGRLTRAEVLTDSDGESELLLYGKDLQFLRAGEMSIGPREEEADYPAELLTGVTIAAEPRNYAPEAWAKIVADSPLPVEEQVAWSSLPPLIWVLYIPVTWGAIKFAGSFLSRLGEVAADGFVSWITRAAKGAKEPERESLVEIRFQVPDGPAILGFVPLNAESDSSVIRLNVAVDQAGLLAEFSGSVAAGQQPSELRRCAFIWDADQWRLAWWATDESVYVTPWFSQNYPDPERFLGRPVPQIDDDEQGDLNTPTPDDA